MLRISSLVTLIGAVVLVNCQDVRICIPSPSDYNDKLPALTGNVFIAGYEKKRTSDPKSAYTFSQGGVHTYASATANQPAREAMKVLMTRSDYKDVMDYTSGQVLLLDMSDPWSSVACSVIGFDDYAKLEDSIARLIGFDRTTKPILGPLGVFFLDLMVYADRSDRIYNDVAAETYSTCYWNETQKLTANIVWRYVKGAKTTTPLSATIVYSINSGLYKQIQYDFVDFAVLDVVGTSPFEIPPFYMCDGWNHAKPPLNLNKTFAFDSEARYRTRSHDVPDVILSYSDQIDAVYNLSRRTTTEGQLDGSVVTTTSIYDGTSGIMYRIDDRLGNCSMSIASASNTDILWTHLLNPSDFWQTGTTQYYVGEKTWRGLLCDAYVYEVLDTLYRVRVRYEIYVAKSTDKLALPVEQLPVAQLVSPDPDHSRVTLYQQIYNYDVNTATIAEFDISSCFVLEQQRHFVMTFPAADWIVQQYSDLLKDSFIRSAAVAGQISPVRIANVIVESTDFLKITFTVLHTTHVPNANAQIHASDAVSNLYQSVTSGQFSFTLRYQTDQKFTTTATNMEEVTRRTPLNWFRGFSGGEMAAIALSMFFGSLIIAVVLFWFVVVPFYDTGRAGGTEVNVYS